jgi:hypothetical protein
MADCRYETKILDIAVSDTNLVAPDAGPSCPPDLIYGQPTAACGAWERVAARRAHQLPATFVAARAAGYVKGVIATVMEDYWPAGSANKLLAFASHLRLASYYGSRRETK